MTEPPNAHRDLTLDDALAHPWVQEDLARWEVAPEDLRRWLSDSAAEPMERTEAVLARMMIWGAIVCRIETAITLDDPTWAGLDAALSEPPP